MPTDGPCKLAVDATDVAILRELARAGSGQFQSQKATLETVADGLGLHPNTVAGRLKRMQEGGGVGSRLTVLPQPNVLGISGGHFFATVPMSRRTDALLEEVFALGCIFNIIETLDGWHISPFATDDAGLDALAERIRAFLGSEPVRWTMRCSVDWPALAPAELDETDLEILGALLVNGQAPMDELADLLGLNRRTVQRHFERLRDAQAFRLYPFGDAMLIGLAFRFLQLDLPNAGAARRTAETELEKLLPNCFVRQVLTRGVQFLLYADEQGELERQVELATAVPGVSVVINRQFRRAMVSRHYPKQMLDILRTKVRLRGVHSLT